MFALNWWCVILPQLNKNASSERFGDGIASRSEISPIGWNVHRMTAANMCFVLVDVSLMAFGARLHCLRFNWTARPAHKWFTRCSSGYFAKCLFLWWFQYNFNDKSKSFVVYPFEKKKIAEKPLILRCAARLSDLNFMSHSIDDCSAE